MKKAIKIDAIQLAQIIAALEAQHANYCKHGFPESLCDEVLDLKLQLEDVQATSPVQGIAIHDLTDK